MLPKKEARFAASSLINSKYFPYWKPRSAAERILSECVKKKTLLTTQNLRRRR